MHFSSRGIVSADPGHSHSIKLNLRDISQLFNSMDPSPFIEKDLDDDAEEFIVGWAQEFVGGGVWRAWDQGVFSVGQGPAYEPWRNWRSASDGPLGLVRAAILAASPHNTQPWLFKVASSSIELYVDTARNTGALDPFLREQRIGLGCAVENLLLAARANGYQATQSLMPGKLTGAASTAQPQLVARVKLTAGIPQQSELYDAIPRRHTNRNPYDPNRHLPGDFVEQMRAATSTEPDVRVFLFTDEKDRKKIAEIISQANDVLYADPAVAQGSEE